MKTHHSYHHPYQHFLQDNISGLQQQGPSIHSFKDSTGWTHLIAAEAPSSQVGALLQQGCLHSLDLLNVLLTGYRLGGQAVLNLGVVGSWGVSGVQQTPVSLRQ